MPSVVDHPFDAYRGTEPFIFVSYSHRDGAAVFAELKYLHELGYRVWYDEGIDPGNEWTDEIARALDSAAYFIVYITDSAVRSSNVRNEINFALNRRKPFLAIHLAEVELPKGLELRMADIQAIFKWQMPEEMYRRKLGRALPATALGAPGEVQNSSAPKPSRKGEGKPSWLPSPVVWMSAAVAVMVLVLSAAFFLMPRASFNATATNSAATTRLSVSVQEPTPPAAAPAIPAPTRQITPSALVPPIPAPLPPPAITPAEQLKAIQEKMASLQVDSSSEGKVAQLRGLVSEMTQRVSNMERATSPATQKQIEELSQKVQGDETELTQLKSQQELDKDGLYQEEMNIANQLNDLLHKNPSDGSNNQVVQAAAETEKARLDGVMQSLKQREQNLETGSQAQVEKKMENEIADNKSQILTLISKGSPSDMSAFNHELDQAKTLFADLGSPLSF